MSHIVVVGLPGSGKSSYAKKFKDEYEIFDDFVDDQQTFEKIGKLWDEQNSYEPKISFIEKNQDCWGEDGSGFMIRMIRLIK